MRIHDLLNDTGFADLELLGGSTGTGNVITAVTVVDTPDGALWLNGGELVITTGFMLGDDEESLLSFMKVLSQHRVSGLGIKRNRHITRIPDSALRLADMLALPVIAIPETYAFSDIINPVLTRIIDQQYAELSQSNIIHDKFLELAVNDRPVYEILQVLSLIVGIPSAFVDTYFDELYFSDPNGSLAQQMRGTRPDTVTDSFLERYDHYAVANQSSVFGYVLFPKGSLEKSANSSYQVAVEQAGITLILRMQVRISNKYIEERYKSVFVEDLLLNNIKGELEIHNRAQLYNWDFRDGGLVAVVDINNLKKHFSQKLDSSKNRMLEEMAEKVFDLAIREMRQMFRNVKYMRQSDLIAFLISVPAEERKGLEGQLREVFARMQSQLAGMTSFTISVGVGSYYDNIRDIYKSYADARTTINLSYALQWFDCILFYEEMGLYRMLTPILDSKEAKEYCEKYLDPLETYDAENGQELLSTLNEIIQTGWNLKKAAENMYLHYNSMKYRYNRICAIMGLDLSKQANRLMISIALIVHMMNRSQLPDTKRYIPIY